MIVATNKSNEQFACDDEVTDEVVVKLRAGMEHRIGRLVCSASIITVQEKLIAKWHH